MILCGLVNWLVDAVICIVLLRDRSRLIYPFCKAVLEYASGRRNWPPYSDSHSCMP